ncbi:hypothetical protein VMCG_04767 [Cytospora schulzeri]|uniref:Uncharacterized protein n=1 Tax=Cytospora schulzeri TaxID=448051 RepID=A0A423WNG2_9PEZI|nr:hypothetical protein VMCG_04767 [Valsa malicola]
MQNPSGGGGISGEAAKVDESYVTATCKNARLEINALASKRKNLRINITALQEKLKQTEDDYWSQYHVRLNGTDVSTSTNLWVSNFATKEGVVAKRTKQRLDEFRRQVQGLEVQLQKADDEFWGKWQDIITKLANIPQLNPTPPEAHQPVCVHTTTAPSKAEDETAPPSQPQTTPMLPIYAAASPLAPPVFFPHGPPLETPTTNQSGAQQIETPIVVTEPSQLFETAQSRVLPQVSDITEMIETHHDATATSPVFQGVTNPKVGHVYKAYYKHESHEGWWMCTVLPTLPAHKSEAWAREVGISFPSASLDLWHDAPKCYSSMIQTKRKTGKSTKRHHVLTGWESGYEDGKPLVTQRAFPVLFFEDRKGVQGHFDVPMPPKKFNFKPHAWDWVEAKNLRPVDTDVGPVYGEMSADRFVKRLEALGQESTPTPANKQEGRPVKRPRIKIIRREHPSTQAQPYSTEGQQATDVADVRSLSGDTIAASSSSSSSSTVQSDDELTKPLRFEPSVPAGLDSVNTGRQQKSGDEADDQKRRTSSQCSY